MPVLLVTGANRGLGLEYAGQFAAEGWEVIAGVRRADKAHCEALSVLPGVRVERIDVSDPGSIAAAARRLEGTAIDLLVNNAGLLTRDFGTDGALQGLKTVDPERWIAEFRVNAMGPVLVARAFRDHLAAGKTRLVVNMGSGMGSLARAEDGGGYYYRTSKAALNMATRLLAHDLAGLGITVVALDPGWVRTRMGGETAPVSAADSVADLRRTIARITPDMSGGFFSRRGEPRPW